MTGDSFPVTETVHNGNEVAVILLVTSMIEYRNRIIAALVERIENGSARMHRERRAPRLGKQAQDLTDLADRITILAQDNAYDVRNLMVHLGHRQEQGSSAEGNTGHHGQVCYIQ
jgi:hypothetical protein